MTETNTRQLQNEVQSLRAEVHALKEQMAAYSVRPPVATDHPHIVRVEGVQGGEPIIRGAYVTVRGIVELARLGQTAAQIVEEHAPLLSLAQVYDALSYYYDHQAEIDAYLQEHESALQRATRLSRRPLKRSQSPKRATRPKMPGAHARG